MFDSHPVMFSLNILLHYYFIVQRRSICQKRVGTQKTLNLKQNLYKHKEMVYVYNY